MLRQKEKVGGALSQPSEKVGQLRTNSEIRRFSLTPSTLKSSAEPTSGLRGLATVNCSTGRRPHDSGKHSSDQIAGQTEASRKESDTGKQEIYQPELDPPLPLPFPSPSHTPPPSRVIQEARRAIIQQDRNCAQSLGICSYLFSSSMCSLGCVCLALAFVPEALAKRSQNFGH